MKRLVLAATVLVLVAGSNTFAGTQNYNNRSISGTYLLQFSGYALIDGSSGEISALGLMTFNPTSRSFTGFVQFTGADSANN